MTVIERRLLHSEWTKFRTVRGWAWGMVAAMLTIVAVGLIGTAAANPNGGASLPVGPGGEAVNDSFYFVHQSLQGNGSVIARVTSLTGEVAAGGPRGGATPGLAPWAKAGIIVKQSLAQGSSYAAMMVTAAHGVRMQYDYTHDAPGLTGRVSASSPRWLRLTRYGDTVTGYDSVNGTSWTEVGTVRLSGLSSAIEVGMFTTTPQAAVATSTGTGMIPAVATGTFDRIALGGQWLYGRPTGGSWTGTQVGKDAGTSGSYLENGSGKYAASGGVFTLTGAGDIAPVVGGSAFASGRVIENFLVGGFAGLIVVIVIATGFITAEYRRGLLGLTLAATPRRGRVLAAKAAVLGLAAFAVGVVAALVAIPLGERQSAANGFAVATVPLATEVRVMLGTGLLLAAASVLALAVGTIVRRSAVAITIPVAGLVLPYILATSGTLPDGAADWLLRVTPAAGFAIQQSLKYYAQVDTTYNPSSGYFPLSPLGGFAVLCGYTALAFAAAVILLRRRDAS
jgi:ABC-type transport system involved in multi-copper enzyme maturation permease subunit